MSDIKVGDLVMIARPTKCCGNYSGVGEIHTVTRDVTKPLLQCMYCFNFRERTDEVYLSIDSGIEKSRLIKIDPPALDETTESERELIA